MTILTNTGGIASTNCYLVVDEQTKKAVLFDAPNDTTADLMQEARRRGYDVIGLWFTHGHFDHVADHAVVNSLFPDAKVMIHPGDEPKLAAAEPRLFPLPFDIPPRKPDAHLADGQVLHIGNIEVRVMHTPGHCAGHVVFYFPTEGAVIGGDLIIQNSVGRTDLPDSSYRTLQQSIRKVMDLPDETQLFPGHGRPSTLRHELETNCYVQEAVAGGM